MVLSDTLQASAADCRSWRSFAHPSGFGFKLAIVAISRSDAGSVARVSWTVATNVPSPSALLLRCTDTPLLVA